MKSQSMVKFPYITFFSLTALVCIFYTIDVMDTIDIIGDSVKEESITGQSGLN